MELHNGRRKVQAESLCPDTHRRASVSYRHLVSEEAAIAEVTLRVAGREYVGTGTAKTHPKDEPNDEIGLLLAYARAFQEAAEGAGAEAERLIYPPTTLTMKGLAAVFDHLFNDGLPRPSFFFTGRNA